MSNYKVTPKGDAFVLVEQRGETPNPNEFDLQPCGAMVLPTLDSDKPYWSGKVGEVVGEGSGFEVAECQVGGTIVNQDTGTTTKWFKPHAMPPKEDVWEEAVIQYKRETPKYERSIVRFAAWMQSHYHLTKK